MRFESDAAERVDGLVFLLSLVAVAIVLGSIAGLPLAPLRLPAGLLVGLFVPGYVLLRATVGGRLHGTMRFVLAVPLTLGLAAITGVVLDTTPLGVRGDAIGWRCASPPWCWSSSPFARHEPGAPPPRRCGAIYSWSPSRLAGSIAPEASGRCAHWSFRPSSSESRWSARWLPSGLKIAASVDGSLDPDAPIVLTGRVQAATQTGGGRAVSRIALTLANNRPRPGEGAAARGRHPGRREEQAQAAAVSSLEPRRY